MTNFSRLFFVSFVLFFAACVPKVAKPPEPIPGSLADMVSGRAGILRIDAELDVVFEKQDSEMFGNAVLDIAKDGDLHMKVYTLGILGMDISSKNGIVKSTPKLDSSKKAILTRGLRDSLFWWDISDYSVQEEKDGIVLLNTARQVILDRKTMLPVKQKITFDDGKQLTVLYFDPVNKDGLWYQSKMRIELSRYAVTIKVKKISFSGRN